MRFINKGLLVFALVLILFSIGAIHAENNTDIGSYTNLTNQINAVGDESAINLTSNYKFDDDADSGLNSGIAITRSMTINGNNTYIDGNHKARGLLISNNCEVIIENLTFKNCFDDVNGGAAIFLRSNSNLTLKNCKFIDNKVYNANGGAVICQNSANVNVYNCDFSNNIAIRESDLKWEEFKKGMGSAFCMGLNSKLNLYDSVFKNCNAHLSTILVISHAEGNRQTSSFLARNCVFENNTSKSNGVVYIDELGQAEIQDSVFKNNRATESGGIVVFDASIFAIVKNCLFEGNSAVRGGAIFSIDFKGNLSNVSVINSNFSRNSVSEYGGAIYAKSTTLTIMNSNFNGNTAKERGGAICTREGTIKLSKSAFNKNSAADGGAAYLTSDKINVENTRFSQNSASQNGGAIYSKSNSQTIADSSFEANTAKDKGGAVCSKEGTMKLSRSTFNKNSAVEGGAVYLNNNKITIDNTRLSQNTASQKGGAVFSKVVGVSALNCNYVNNKAPAGMNVYGVYNIKLTKTSTYFGYVALSVKITSPWKAPLSQNIKFRITGSGLKKVIFAKTDAKGILSLHVQADFKLGKYSLECAPNDGVFNQNKFTINVVKAPAKAIVKKMTAKYKSGKKWNIKVKNTKNKKLIPGAKLKLKVYTGKKCKTYKVTTDKMGVIKFDTKKIKFGKHIVKISASNKNIKLSKNVKTLLTIK